MQVLEGPDQGQIIKFCLTENQPFFKVGRKTENNLSVMLMNEINLYGKIEYRSISKEQLLHRYNVSFRLCTLY